jgi:hypothetical protein
MTRDKIYAALISIAFTFASIQAFGGSAAARGRLEVAVPTSGGAQFTCTYDLPWDWVHRCPSVVSPAERSSYPVVRPSAPGCPAQTVTVPTGSGKEQTVTVVRC